MPPTSPIAPKPLPSVTTDDFGKHPSPDCVLPIHQRAAPWSETQLFLSCVVLGDQWTSLGLCCLISKTEGLGLAQWFSHVECVGIIQTPCWEGRIQDQQVWGTGNLPLDVGGVQGTLQKTQGRTSLTSLSVVLFTDHLLKKIVVKFTERNYYK